MSQCPRDAESKTLAPSAPLCHLPGTFFKDLQTNFPETFRAQSGIHWSCFTLPVFTQNHPKRESPQHTPAKTLASVSKNFFRLLSPSIPPFPRGPRSGLPDCPWSKAKWVGDGQPAAPHRRVSPPLHSRSIPPRPRSHPLRLVEFSTFPPTAPTHVRHKCWHNPREACVTLCHLGFLRPGEPICHFASRVTAPRISRAAVAASLAEITA